MAKTKLHIVTETHRAVIDIYAAWKAEVDSRDWEACHIAGDKRAPVELPETRKRSWVK